MSRFYMPFHIHHNKKQTKEIKGSLITQQILSFFWKNAMFTLSSLSVVTLK